MSFDIIRKQPKGKFWGSGSCLGYLNLLFFLHLDGELRNTASELNHDFLACTHPPFLLPFLTLCFVVRPFSFLYVSPLLHLLFNKSPRFIVQFADYFKYSPSTSEAYDCSWPTFSPVVTESISSNFLIVLLSTPLAVT